MRELILLRHAHAEPPAQGQDDMDRPLSRQGLAEAEAAGHWLKAHGYLPDRILASPARRTRETLEQVLQVLGYVEQLQDPRIYEATPGTLMQVADEHREHPRVLLVGHNPGLEQMAALLASGQSGDFRGMPAGGVAVLSMPIDAALEIDRFANDHRAYIKLTNKPAAVPAGGERGDHDRISIIALTARLSKRICFTVDRRIIFLDATVMSAAEQFPFCIKERRTDRNAPFGQTELRLFDRDIEHLLVIRSHR